MVKTGLTENCSFLCPHINRWGTYSIWPVCPSVRLFVHKNFYIGHSFWMVSDRAFILHIYIPWGKTLSLISKSRWCLKVKYQGHSFWKNGRCGGIHKHILFFMIEWLENVVYCHFFCFYQAKASPMTVILEQSPTTQMMKCWPRWASPDWEMSQKLEWSLRNPKSLR